MNPLTKIGRAFRADMKQLGAMIFGRSSGVSLGIFFRGSAFDYTAYVGEGTDNSAVANCLAWIGRTFPEAPLRVLKAAGEDWEPVAGHPLTELCEYPNDYYSGSVLWMATLASFNVDGNAYWLKERAAAGRVVRLWWVPHTLMTPVAESGTSYIDYYRYTPGGRYQPLALDPADVVHFRNGLDPDNPRLGRSPLKAALREVFSDDEAANFFGALMKNMGVPGVLIAPDTETAVMTPTDAEAIRADFANRFTGDGRGMPLVMPARTKVEIMSFSPEQMNLRDLRRLPEERISGALGVPAIVAGLGAGLDRSTFSNYEEARKAAWEDNILPTQRLLAADLRSQLLDDFGERAGLRIEFDTSGVRVLQEDQTALYTRTLAAMAQGAITVAEARRAMGFTADAEHEVYYVLESRTAVGSLLDLVGTDTPQPAPLAAVATPSPTPALPAGDQGTQTTAPFVAGG